MHVGTSLAVNAGASDERERELLRLVGRGDRAAFRELYIAYHRRLARFLARMTFHHELIEEVINDTMWTVWRKAAEFRGESRPSTWIVGIAYRRSLKALHTERARRAVSVEEGGALVGTQSMEEEREWIERALAELPSEQRMVLELGYLLGHSCDEIAAIMQCPVNTVKTRMFHARAKMRSALPRLAGSSE
jgi:RNA polymerase sigma-70 factor (ECF subfamily)